MVKKSAYDSEYDTRTIIGTIEDERLNNKPSLGSIRIAKVSYDYHEIVQSEDGVEHSIGAMIDTHIFKTIESGSLVSEVSLFFETQEQQERLRAFYSSTRNR